MELSDLAAVAAESIGSCIGEPEQARLPRRCPVRAFVCPVVLPRGCLPPPGALPLRVGAGAALDRATARSLCVMEGIERYSLQYRAGDPERQRAVRFPGARIATLAVDRLRLGHPAQRDGGTVADSRGCAAGPTLADAALRGLLELAEYDAVADWRSGACRFQSVEAHGVCDPLDRLLTRTEAERLSLRVFARRHPSGAVVCAAVCADASGARPATGSAAGLDLGRTALTASVEAVLAWFNFAEIARHGTGLAALPEESRIEVETWLGLRDPPGFPVDGRDFRGESGTRTAPDPEQEFSNLVARWGVDVAVFDMSRKETGIATARVVRLLTGQSGN